MDATLSQRREPRSASTCRIRDRSNIQLEGIARLDRRITPANALLVLSSLSILVIGSTLAFPSFAIRGAARDLTFDVLLDERPIGTQRFALRPQPDGLRVETRADFELTLLRIKALDYAHRNVEEWRGGCLQSIDSSTRQNGKPYRVTGAAGADGFAVSGASGEQKLSDCVGTFSYWDRGQLAGRSKLLNSQTGEYVSVALRELGRGTLELAGRAIAVDRYLLEGKDLEITLAYAVESGEWLALDSPVWGGFTLRYRRSAADLPAVVDTTSP